MDIKKALIILLLLILITGCASIPKFPGIGTKKAKSGVGININFKDGQPRIDRISETAGFKVTPILKNYIPEEISTEVCVRDTWDASKGGIEQAWDCQGISLESAETTEEGEIRAESTEEVEFPRYYYFDIVEESNQYSTDIIAKVTYSVDVSLSPRFTVPAGTSKFSVSGKDLSTSAKYLPVTISDIDISSNAEDYEAELDLIINIKNNGGGIIIDEFGKEKETISIAIDSSLLDITCPNKYEIKLIDNKAEVNCIALLTDEVFPTTTGIDITLTYDYQIGNKIENIPIVA